MRFSALSAYLDKLEQTSSRNDITEILSRLFKKSDKKEIGYIVNLLLGRLAPPHSSLVFNMADRMMLQALAVSYEGKLDEVKSKYKSLGDMGIVAVEIYKGHDKGYTVRQVFETLETIALYEGEGSVERKVEGMAKLLSEVDSLSARYLARIPVGKLRLGFSDKTIIDALSYYLQGDKSAKKALEAAYQVMPDVGRLAAKVRATGRVPTAVVPVVGVPVMPMLPQRLKSTTEMIKKMGRVAVEPKFDGLRVIIHYKKGKFIRAYTRNLNEVSDMFPELAHIGKQISARSAIIDTEAVGLNPKTQKMVDFQKTMSRRRKHNIGKISEDIPIQFQVFDLMAKNGKSFMDKTYVERREVLSKTVKKGKVLVVDEYLVTDDAKLIAKDHARLLKLGLEGVIVKRLDSTYVPGRTGWRWVKMKEVEGEFGKLSDTVDALVMGYTRGKGRRASFGLGQFLAAVRKSDKFLSITKVGTGLTDAQFKLLSKMLKKIRVKEKPKEYEVIKDLEPDFWVKPSLVVELAADEITKSPRHTSHYALRFPRLVQFRDDKSPRQVTTVREIKNLYKLQK